MLLNFRVRNYRSIRDEQSLNLVASNPDKSFRETHLVSTGLKSIPHAVRSAVLYGPNASGKSNLLRALDFMRAVVGESATSMVPGALFNVQPFRLDTESSGQPTEFEISFLMGGGAPSVWIYHDGTAHIARVVGGLSLRKAYAVVSSCLFWGWRPLFL